MSDLNKHDIGDLVRLAAVFRNIAGALTDPDAVTLRILRPDGTVQVETWPPDGVIVNDAAQIGRFYADISPILVGDYWFRFEGTGAVTEAEESRFRIRRRVVV